VSILPGLPGGLFDDRSARVLPTGTRPVQALVGDFDGRQDLVTVNSNSNDLTFFSNVASPDTLGKRISTGGIAPVAALAENTGEDGRSDLIVANSGDGRLTLLTGTPNGLQLSQSLQEPGLHPAALAAPSGLTAGSFYVLNAGQASATLMQFDMPQTISNSLTLTPAAVVEATQAQPSGPILEDEAMARSSDWLVSGRSAGVDLQPLTPTGAAVIPGVALRTDATRPAPNSAGQPALVEEEGSAGSLARVEPPPALPGDEHPSVQRFIIGVDQEPAPRIGPEGASEAVKPPGQKPDLRPAALPIVFGSPSPPVPEMPEPIPNGVGGGIEKSVAGVPCFVFREEDPPRAPNFVRSMKPLLALTAFGLVMGWRWREEEQGRK
jgi:hypothetical protein